MADMFVPQRLEDAAVSKLVTALADLPAPSDMPLLHNVIGLSNPISQPSRAIRRATHK